MLRTYIRLLARTLGFMCTLDAHTTWDCLAHYGDHDVGWY